MIEHDLQVQLEALLAEVNTCTQCKAYLPLGPRPVLRAHSASSILVVGQAPGIRVHESGIPWNDPSGVRLRAWLGVDSETFYDPACFAIIPMGFCYPGRKARGGDLPPRPECAPRWHERLRACLPKIALTLLVGSYAQQYYLGARRGTTLTETVERWREFESDYFPMPHPSPRNILWLRRNPWFESEAVPVLRARVQRLLAR